MVSRLFDRKGVDFGGDHLAVDDEDVEAEKHHEEGLLDGDDEGTEGRASLRFS